MLGITHSYKELMSPQEEKELENLLQTIPDIDELQGKLTTQLENFEVVSIILISHEIF